MSEPLAGVVLCCNGLPPVSEPPTGVVLCCNGLPPVSEALVGDAETAAVAVCVGAAALSGASTTAGGPAIHTGGKFSGDEAG